MLPHVVSAAVIVYLTYFFTMFFSSRPPAPAAVAEDVRGAAKKIEERQAEDRKLLSNYGSVDPATQTLRIPIDRAMELLVAESHQSPPATAPTTIASATAPKPGTATAPGQPAATAAVSAPAPAKGGMSPTQLYHAVCIACHGADGRGTVVRQAMPVIPDFTDPKWQASRTDADLSHSMLDGKGQLMLPMKDKFALAHTDVKEMLSLVRGFQPGHPAVAAGPKPAAPATATAPTAVASAPAPKPSTATAAPAPQPATAAVPAPSPAKGEVSAEQLYHTVCIACHGVDGRGSVVRQAMPVIPDFTNPKWEASRTDADLRQSILHGKGQLMLPMKDKLALAHTDVNAMLSLVRSFQSGQPAVAAGPKPAMPATAEASAPAPKPGPATVETAPQPAPTVVAAAPKPGPTTVAATAPQPAATTAKLRASVELFRTDCIVCHGPDGRGTTVRAAMPPIPDFTTREFQSTHDPAQLSVSILEGKGTLMPPWHGKISPAQARDLVAYVRRFGPADLLTTETPANEFGTRYRALKKQWDDLELQAQALSRP